MQINVGKQSGDSVWFKNIFKSNHSSFIYNSPSPRFDCEFTRAVLVVIIPQISGVIAVPRL